MVYDAAREQLVLFGGYDGHYLNDTWTWDGTAWTKATPTTSPFGRENGAMTYDSLRQRIVLYGGDNQSSRTHVLGSLWEWDGTSWAR